MFSREFSNFFKNSIFKEHLWITASVILKIDDRAFSNFSSSGYVLSFILSSKFRNLEILQMIDHYQRTVLSQRNWVTSVLFSFIICRFYAQEYDVPVIDFCDAVSWNDSRWYLKLQILHKKAVHPRVGSASRVQLGIPRVELGIFLEKSYYSGRVTVLHANNNHHKEVLSK